MPVRSSPCWGRPARANPPCCGFCPVFRGLSSGQVIWHGQPLAGPCPNVAIVFQSFALFPWLTVLDNVEAPLKARGVPAYERMRRSVKILDSVGLDGFEAAFPKELSGGMKQRVGFAPRLGGGARSALHG